METGSRKFKKLWASVTGGALLRALGSAFASFFFLGAPTLGSWRVKVGARFTYLQRRAHGTPTGRCSVGHWETILRVATPADDAGWGRLASGFLAVIDTHGTPVPWEYRSDPSGDENRCHTAPSFARGNCRPHIPGRALIFGDEAPAKGRRLGQHDYAAIKARVRGKRRREASIRYAAARKVRTYRSED